MKRKVVVTTDTDRKGVFFGTLVSENGDVVELENARMAIYWSVETKGVLGLAGIGPQNGSKITPSVPTIKINGVTAVIGCTEDAVRQWEKGLWS